MKSFQLLSKELGCLLDSLFLGLLVLDLEIDHSLNRRQGFHSKDPQVLPTEAFIIIEHYIGLEYKFIISISLKKNSLNIYSVQFSSVCLSPKESHRHFP